jgi:nucleoside-diphosphate-sugar epimerase
MKVFLAGATGAIGKRLVPLLVKAGHTVTGTTRSQSKAESLRSAGATPAVLDALNRDEVLNAVRQSMPDVIIHQLTAITDIDMRHFDRVFAQTNRLRTEETDHLLAAAQAVNCQRFIAQSYAGWPFARVGGPVKTEDDPLDPNPPAAMRTTLDAIRYLEQSVTSAPGIDATILRYAGFYGPGNALGEGGTGIWSFLHIDDAAGATLAVLERGAKGTYNIADDEPAPVSQWLPALAADIGAKPPMRISTWLARLAAGEVAVVMMTQSRGASNAKAKRELNWKLKWPTWREGFKRGLA